MSEEASPKKEDELFGIPLSKLGVPAIGLATVGVVLGIAAFLRPQIEQIQRDMAQRQAYAQQAQLAAAAEQQRLLQQQHQHPQDPYNSPQEGQPDNPNQSEPQPQQVADPGYAVEQDPFSRQSPRKVRIPEVEADGSGSSRFNNISI